MTTIEINGTTTEVPAGAIAWKLADPTEDARWVYDEADLREIRSEDPGLLVMVDEANQRANMNGVENFIGFHITIPAWDVDGQIIDQRAAMIGTDDDIELLVEECPDDPCPRWYRFPVVDGELAGCILE